MIFHADTSTNSDSRPTPFADDVVFSKKAITDFVAGPAKGSSAKGVGRESELVEVSA